MPEHRPESPTGIDSEGANPGLVFETLNAHQRSAALTGALELDLFTAIGEGASTADAVSRQCGTNARATRILCDFLAADGFITKGDAGYGLSPTAAVYLDRRSPKYIGSIAKFTNSPHQLEAYRDVAELVRQGRTLLGDHGTTEHEYSGWIEFARSMVPMLMPAANFLADLAFERFSGPIRVLDIAAGHGMFGISVAQKNPHATIVALDWPGVLQVARENAVAADVQDRFSELSGNALDVDYGCDFDLVMATNFLHHFDRPTCVSVMKKIRDCLKPGGAVYTLEFIPNEDRITPAVPAKFSLTMLATTPAGEAYTFSDFDSMFRESGFGTSEMLDLPAPPQRVIVTTL